MLLHWADARPAWLWSQDGETLLWRNDAARFFHGRIKKHGVKLAPDAVPIKGQIARLIRLGSMGRPSLSRIQFLAGERPISTTCTCTPLELGDGAIGLLIVGVDPIEPELLEARDHAVPPATDLFPRGSEILVVNEDGQITDGTRHALEHYAPLIESDGLPEAADGGRVELAGESLRLSRFTASPHDAMLLLFEPSAAEDAQPAARSIAEIRADEGEAASDDAPTESAEALDEPMLPLGLPPAEHADDEPVLAEEENWVEPISPAGDADGTLSSLFDRLADDETLFTPLTASDEHFAGPPPEPVSELVRTVDLDVEPVPETVAIEPILSEASPDEVEPAAAELPPEPQLAAEPTAPTEPDVIAALIDYADEEPEVAPTTWRVIGRGFTAASLTEPKQAEPATDVAAAIAEAPLPTEPAPAEPASTPPDAEAVERVSRYNFDELSRILTDRVNGQGATPRPEEPEPAHAPAEGALINLTGETFILNRLPLGILVFRDQQVLFANRALTDLTGYDSIESLRAAGLTAIFPSEEAVGPVTRLVKRDGSLSAVNARLQSITWHGRPALMLSASAAETRLGHEAAVRSFAELAAEISDDGFLAADRAGIVTFVSLHGRIVLGLTENEIVGRPLAVFIDPGQLGELKTFLERPARFAETARPAILFTGANSNVRLSLFAEGQAGIVAGYFALLRKHPAPLTTAAPPQSPAAEDVEPSMLRRVSQSVRRPLNAVIGFADLIRDGAEAQRTTEYALDIKTAGTEIANLVDELDEYARLREGRYPAEPDDLDLASLLESCLARVRKQAGEARVLVRSAVSERLPRITADRASLTQGILNLLASAIDQTPVGGSVILSAQREDDGAVIVNVRDGGETRRDLGERFVVFRDGLGKDGEVLLPVRSSVGLALTRSLLAVNALKLSVDPLVGVGNMFSLLIPADLVRE
ncbi:histidine kinase dimerization/phospho-acceptor domain-containing protein [Devosia sp. CN2-171]|uniref:PAS domain-containing sensor histidine kinase n=1 Tax=Devosia sp. CN2-171 TaxID=3400909 RepID=UPI003BF8C3F6